MSSDTENRSQGKSLIDNLTARNRELSQTIEKAQAPTAVTIPYERRQAEIQLLKAASDFQPELYRMINLVATREELQKHVDRIVNIEKNYMNTTAQNYSKECREMTKEIRQLIEQDGKNRESFISECSSVLKAERDKLSQELENLRKRTRRLLIAVFITAAASLSIFILILLLFPINR